LDKDTYYLSSINIHSDHRGFFFESFRKNDFNNIEFVQDNISHSTKGALRGLHYQYIFPQSKLITVVKGKIFDVILDLRKNSNTFMQLFNFTLTQDLNNRLFIPRGFAHGFQCLSKECTIIYKTDNYYKPSDQFGVFPLDSKLNINWPIEKKIISNNDKTLPKLSEIKNFF
jgi:dTDP-4-dehydrorhamnose 3,5-epimerase